MNKIFNITRNDLTLQFKDNSIWINLIVIPAVLIVVIGFVNGGFGNNNGGETVLRVDVFNEDVTDDGVTELSQALLESLRRTNDDLLLCPMDNDARDLCDLKDVETLDHEAARARVEDGVTQGFLEIPDGFQESVLDGKPVDVAFRSNNDPLNPSFLIQSIEAAVQRVSGAALAAQVGSDILTSVASSGSGSVADYASLVYEQAATIWDEVDNAVGYRLSAENTASFSVQQETLDDADVFDAQVLPVDVVTGDGGEVTTEFVNLLDDEDIQVCNLYAGENTACQLGEDVTLDVETARQRVEDGVTAGYVVLPDDFDGAISDGGDVPIEVVTAPSVNLADTVERSARRVEPSSDTNITGFGQSVPGIGSMYVMFTVLQGGALLIQERRNWTLQRLVTMPVSRAQIISGKMLARFAMGLIQFGVAFAIGLILGVHFGDAPLALLLVIMAFTLCITAIAFLLANFMETDQQASGIITFFVLVTSPLGGAWWPLEVVPDFMQTVAYVTPVGWAMEGFGEVIFYGGGVADVLLPVGVLLAATVVIFGLAVMQFRYTE